MRYESEHNFSIISVGQDSALSVLVTNFCFDDMIIT